MTSVSTLTGSELSDLLHGPNISLPFSTHTILVSIGTCADQLSVKDSELNSSLIVSSLPLSGRWHHRSSMPAVQVLYDLVFLPQLRGVIILASSSVSLSKTNRELCAKVPEVLGLHSSHQEFAFSGIAEGLMPTYCYGFCQALIDLMWFKFWLASYHLYIVWYMEIYLCIIYFKIKFSMHL